MLKGPAVAAGGGFRRLKLNLDWLENLWKFKCLSLSLFFFAQQVGLSQTSRSSCLSFLLRNSCIFVATCCTATISCWSSWAELLLPGCQKLSPSCQLCSQSLWTVGITGTALRKLDKGLSKPKEKTGAILVSKTRKCQTLKHNQTNIHKTNDGSNMLCQYKYQTGAIIQVPNWSDLRKRIGQEQTAEYWNIRNTTEIDCKYRTNSGTSLPESVRHGLPWVCCDTVASEIGTDTTSSCRRGMLVNGPTKAHIVGWQHVCLSGKAGLLDGDIVDSSRFRLMKDANIKHSQHLAKTYQNRKVCSASNGSCRSLQTTWQW